MIMIMILTFSAKIVPTGTYLQATSASMGTTDLLYTVVVDSCKLVFDGMYIFREAFRLLAVLFNQLSKSGNIYRGE